MIRDLGKQVAQLCFGAEEVAIENINATQKLTLDALQFIVNIVGNFLDGLVVYKPTLVLVLGCFYFCNVFWLTGAPNLEC